MCFPSINTHNLTFLDLSYTDCSTTWSQYFSILPLQHLRILKLQGLRLTDRYIPKLELRSGRNLWSLDLRDNFLTDTAIETLAGWFLPTLPLRFSDPTLGLYYLPPIYGREHEPSQDGTDGTVALRSDTKDDFLQHMGTGPQARVDIEPLLKQTGLTHLYISGNKITSAGVRQLLSKTNRLNVLDVGSVRDTKDTQFKSRRAISWDQVRSPSSLGIANSYNLKSLRIHHSIVTCMPTITVASASNEGARIPTRYSLQNLLAAEGIGHARIKGGTSTFTPMKNCILETLTLTGIPTKSYGHLVEKLIAFLVACRKQEQELADARVTTHRRAPPVLPGLKTLRLEFLAPDSVDPTHRGSVSGDPDAEVFSEASKEDFSFFPDEAERPATPVRRPTLSDVGNSDVGPAPAARDPPLLDVLEELKRARREAGENKWGGNLEIILPLSSD